MKRFFIKGALLLAVVLALTACNGKNTDKTSSGAASNAPPSEQSSAPETQSLIQGLDAKNYPRVDGSTANMPLMAQLYSTVCGVPLEDAETMVDVSTTSPAWRGLLNGVNDLLIVYEPSESVKAELEEAQVKLESVPLGRDGLVFLVNTANKVDNLTQSQLRDIYTGKITDWGGLGGDAGAIAAFQRDKESGSQTLFEKLLMKGTEPMQAPTELVPGFMSDLIDGIAEYDGSGGAIGYSVFYYAKEMYANPNLKLLAVDGAAPSAETIGDGSYPLVNNFYVAIRADEPEGSPARLLRDWLLTDEGRKTLVTAGYVPVPKNG